MIPQRGSPRVVECQYLFVRRRQVVRRLQGGSWVSKGRTRESFAEANEMKDEE